MGSSGVKAVASSFRMFVFGTDCHTGIVWQQLASFGGSVSTSPTINELAFMIVVSLLSVFLLAVLIDNVKKIIAELLAKED